MLPISECKEETLISRCELPIIDLAHIGEETCSMRSVIKRVGAQLHKAFSEKGLAILVNHGIADEKLKEVYADLDSFCALPDNTTEQFLCNPDTNHGYVKPGMEKLEKGKMELRHAFNITSLSHEDLPNSSLVPDFADHAAHLAHDFTALSRLVLRALSVALQLPSAWLEERHGGMFLGNNASTLRLLLYPPVPPQDDEKAEDVIRCGAHADYGTFTLLAQDSDGGLEVQLAGRNEWQAVGHLPGAILVQPGELLSAWSNGLYPALRHRVVVPRSVYARARKRHAVAYFCHPDNDAVAPPIPPLLLLPAPVPIAAPTRHTFQDRLAGAVHLVHKRFRETYA